MFNIGFLDVVPLEQYDQEEKYVGLVDEEDCQRPFLNAMLTAEKKHA
jgi:hypothetical protein